MKPKAALAPMLIWLAAGPARAEPAADTAAQEQKLGECVALKTTGADRLTVARWMFNAFAAAPQLRDLASVDPQTKVATDQAVARLFTRLLTNDCAAEARPLLQGGDAKGFEAVGGKLGELAMNELFADKDATAALEAYGAYLEQGDFDKVTR